LSLQAEEMTMQQAACVARIDAEYWQIIGLVNYA
jgi:hypothetical protein